MQTHYKLVQRLLSERPDEGVWRPDDPPCIIGRFGKQWVRGRQNSQVGGLTPKSARASSRVNNFSADLRPRLASLPIIAASTTARRLLHGRLRSLYCPLAIPGGASAGDPDNEFTGTPLCRGTPSSQDHSKRVRRARRSTVLNAALLIPTASFDTGGRNDVRIDRGSRRNRRLSFGSAGGNVWRISLGRLRGGTRGVSIVSWRSMLVLLRSRAGELRER